MAKEIIDGVENKGTQGLQGEPGQGVPTGGSSGQLLRKASASDYDTEWATIAGSGDMQAATYDPNTVASDAFNMENMVEGATKKILTSAERTKLTNTSGTNTGDEPDATTTTKGIVELATNAETTTGTDTTRATTPAGVKAVADTKANTSHTHTESDISDLAHKTDIDSLDDVVITTPADNEVIAYDSTSGNYINQTASEAGLQPQLTEGAFVDGDKTKLDGIETGAEVNNISDANATALTGGGETALHSHAGGGGASQLSDLSDVGITTPTNRNVLVADGVNWDSRPLVEADISDLGTYSTATGVENNADVTDTANVTAAGAVMDSEVTSLSGIKSLTVPDNTTISTFGASLVDDLTASAARTTLGVDPAGTDNSTDVTLAGTGTYITIAGQTITVDPITESDISDLGAYITNITGEPLSDLSDVTITTIATGEVLKWNGTGWVNNTLAEAGIAATGHTHTASNVTDFDTEVSNNTDVAANTAARHDAVTVLDSSEIDFTLTGQQITASIIAGSIDETKLDVSTNASLDLADSSVQPGDNISTLTNNSGFITGITGENINNLSDVVVTTPANNEIMAYDTTSGNWINQTASEAGLQPQLTEGAFVDGDKTKLDGIETGADVTDATNVAAAGATMDSDTSTAGKSYVIDEDTMVSNSATKVPTQQSVKAYVDGEVSDIQDGTTSLTAPSIIGFTNATHSHENASEGGQIPSEGLQHTIGCDVEVGTTQAVTENVEETMEFDTENFDSGGDFNTTTHKFTCPVAGKYLVMVQATIQNLADGYYQIIYIYKNTTVEAFSLRYISGSSLEESDKAFIILNCSASDTIHATVKHNYTSFRNLMSGDWSRMSITYLGA